MTFFEKIEIKLRHFVRYFNLRYEAEDPEVVHKEIVKGVNFIGTNLWILFFAIIIASVGLNVNSTAVIIGAMLISPLMGPINGMGYSLATYNFDLFRRSLKNYTFAVITGLVASTLYFLISPVSTAHSELLARTSPTIYDVLIALFGGLAGIVAVCSKIKGNVIPGVAIATALMPPLCTAGYGLANGEIEFFLGALYLFTINTVFIGLSAVIVANFFDLPVAANITPEQKVKINRLMTAIILITIIPSIFFGAKLVQNERFNENAKQFVSKVSVLENNFLLSSKTNTNAKTVELFYSSDEFIPSDSIRLANAMKEYKMEAKNIIIQKGLLKDHQAHSENEMLKGQVNLLSQTNNQNQAAIDSITKQNKLGEDVLKELNILYPSVVSVAVSHAINHTLKAKDSKEVVLVRVNSSKALTNNEKEKITDWLSTRLKKKNIEIFFNN